MGDLNVGREGLGGTGIATAALAIGGYADVPINAPTALTESWNGSSWTEVNDLNTARQRLSAGGTTTSALAFGGGPPNTARNLLGGAGTQTAALAFGGNDGSPTAATEEWSSVSDVVKTLTD